MHGHLQLWSRSYSRHEVNVDIKSSHLLVKAGRNTAKNRYSSVRLLYSFGISFFKERKSTLRKCNWDCRQNTSNRQSLEEIVFRKLVFSLSTSELSTIFYLFNKKILFLLWNPLSLLIITCLLIMSQRLYIEDGIS